MVGKIDHCQYSVRRKAIARPRCTDNRSCNLYAFPLYSPSMDAWSQQSVLGLLRYALCSKLNTKSLGRCSRSGCPSLSFSTNTLLRGSVYHTRKDCFSNASLRTGFRHLAPPNFVLYLVANHTGAQNNLVGRRSFDPLRGIQCAQQWSSFMKNLGHCRFGSRLARCGLRHRTSRSR